MYLLEIARGLSKMQTIDAAQMIAYFICLLYMSVRKFSRNHNGYCRLFFANLVKLSWLCLEGNITNKLDQWYVWNCMDMLGLRTWGSAFLTCLSCMQDAFNKQARWALRLQSCGRNPFSTSNANPVLCKKCIPLSKDTKERTVNWLQYNAPPVRLAAMQSSVSWQGASHHLSWCAASATALARPRNSGEKSSGLIMLNRFI